MPGAPGLQTLYACCLQDLWVDEWIRVQLVCKRKHDVEVGICILKAVITNIARYKILNKDGNVNAPTKAELLSSAPYAPQHDIC